MAVEYEKIKLQSMTRVMILVCGEPRAHGVIATVMFFVKRRGIVFWWVVQHLLLPVVTKQQNPHN